MRLAEVALGSLIAVACVGCPGTIEDPSGFEALAASLHDSGVDREDAAVDAATPALDAAQDAAPDDADTVPEASPSEEDASMRWDGSLQLDASDGAPAPPEAGSDSGLGCDLQTLIQDNCSDVGCHGAPAAFNGLDLTSPDLGQRLLGRQASNNCSNYLLVNPDNPPQSALYIKVTRNACGSRMPLGASLTDVEQACILRWIESLK